MISDWIVVPTTGKKYRVVETRHDFLDARYICAQYGGHLPEPRNESENNLLLGLTSSSTMFYLGMTDDKTEGNWTWESDGTYVTWTNWMVYEDEAEPDGGEAENCATKIKDRKESFSFSLIVTCFISLTLYFIFFYILLNEQMCQGLVFIMSTMASGRPRTFIGQLVKGVKKPSHGKVR